MIICTPPSSHVAIGRQALDGGSHLLIEKPIAHTLDGLEDLLKAADAGAEGRADRLQLALLAAHASSCSSS